MSHGGAAVDTAAPADRVLALMRRMPKVELHVHLEGTVAASRLRAVAQRDGLDVDPRAYAELAHDDAAPRDFDTFLVAFMARLRALRRPDDWAEAVDDLLSANAAQNTGYTEAFITPTGALRGEYVFDDVLRAVAEVEQSWRARRAALRLIVDCPRLLGAATAMDLVRLAATDTTGLVVGVGIGGDETTSEAGLFAEAFAVAADRGLHRTAHAGEHGGPESVRAAVTVLGAERIGHGLSAVEDPALLALLARQRVAVDICPTSNVVTGAWRPADGPHPLRRMLDAGVLVDIGSDDPGIIGSSLSDEWASLVLEHGLTPHRCLEITAASIDACFLDEVERQRLRFQVEADLVDLRDDAAALEEALAF